ncbi:serine/threonine-protein kinase SRPK3 [Phlyctema vagabunda]|uniref:non-specific serine/threonine protein kinase n=1 Tax=Phlyctema vagabunda TaxID=108571 RepID=A0ABR4P9K2_9HELO
MPPQYVTLKITTSNPDFGDKVLHELDINRSLVKNHSPPGFAFVRAAIDDFIATGPTGATHLCLVFEAMREPLSQFQHRLVGDCIPPQLLKVYVDFMLQGLEYLHSDCQIIHTGLCSDILDTFIKPLLTISLDLKADNVLMSFEDPSVIEEYVNAQVDHPTPRKRASDRNIYLSHNDFGTLKSYWMLPKIVDFGLAYQGDGEEPLRHPIQPPLYHASEVLLGIPWSYSADIWNLGVLVGILCHIASTYNNGDMEL